MDRIHNGYEHLHATVRQEIKRIEANFDQRYRGTFHKHVERIGSESEREPFANRKHRRSTI